MDEIEKKAHAIADKVRASHRNLGERSPEFAIGEKILGMAEAGISSLRSLRRG